MERRPYLALDVSRLSKLVNGNAQDKTLLETVLFELNFRKTGAAGQLKRRVEHLLDLAGQQSGDSREVHPLKADVTQREEPRMRKPLKVATHST
jgi:hypothetical protein